MKESSPYLYNTDFMGILKRSEMNSHRCIRAMFLRTDLRYPLEFYRIFLTPPVWTTTQPAATGSAAAECWQSCCPVLGVPVVPISTNTASAGPALPARALTWQHWGTEEATGQHRGSTAQPGEGGLPSLPSTGPVQGPVAVPADTPPRLIRPAFKHVNL